jgi:hypothetical protein
MQGNYITTKELYFDIITARDKGCGTWPKDTLLYLDADKSTGWIYTSGSHGSVWVESLNMFWVFKEMIEKGDIIPWGNNES